MKRDQQFNILLAVLTLLFEERGVSTLTLDEAKVKEVYNNQPRLSFVAALGKIRISIQHEEN